MLSSVRVLSLLILAALVGCGGGSGGGSSSTAGGGGSGGGGGVAPPPPPVVFGFGADTGVSGSGAVVGTFQERGSIIINDRTLTTDNAVFELEGVMGAEADLKEGQQLIVVADLGTSEAEHVFYRSNIKGPVSGRTVLDPLAGAAQFTVLGQTVRTNSTTRYSNGKFATLVDNDLVEISGALDTLGDLHATFVEVEASLSEYKVVGTVANLAAMTFELGGLTVDFNTATLSEFQGTALADGQIVEVKIAPADFTPPANAVATEVELLPSLFINADAEVEFEGFIDRFASPTDFDIAGLPVTTTGSTVFVNGSAGSLAVNVKVEAEGTVNATRTLVATRVIIKFSESIRVEGTVNGVDLTARTVSTDVGLTFAIRTLTELEDDSSVGLDPFTLNMLALGDFVEVRGFLDGTTLVAAELEREDFDPRTRMRGPVTAEDEVGGTVDILGVTVRGVDGVTEYRDIDDITVINQAVFHAIVELSTFVEARWDGFTSTAATADRLSLEEDDD
ncbi:MAG: DUF5666 domain-containing protein [Gammaproteobacteria bacterium]|nr:DUF5666 domain-containing protein [Gammaproteobacteria bacterium]